MIISILSHISLAGKTPQLDITSLSMEGLDTQSIFYDSSLVILSLVFHSYFKQCCPLGSIYVVGRVFGISL